jgi:hypothetical protein
LKVAANEGQERESNMSYIIVVTVPLATAGALKEELEALFSEVGTVSSVSRVETHELLSDLGEEIQPFLHQHLPRPFYSVKMPSLHEARLAKAKLEGSELPNRPGYLLMLSGPHGPGDEP